jgi:hypothetical protein
MILAIATFLLHCSAIPQNAISTVSTTDTLRGDTADRTAERIPPGHAELGKPPLTSVVSKSEVSETSALSRIAVSQDHLEKPRRRDWIALSIAQHGAATFDAWSTRLVISKQGQELNPLLRPFAGNPSLYAAVQVGPLLFDYAGRRMMTSQHGWMRRTWWLPQVLSTTASFVSGTHNLSNR